MTSNSNSNINIRPYRSQFQPTQTPANIPASLRRGRTTTVTNTGQTTEERSRKIKINRDYFTLRAGVLRLILIVCDQIKIK